MTLHLVVGWLRDAPPKTFTSGLAICIEAAMVLTIAGIQHGLKSDPTLARLNFTLWTTVLLLMVAVIGFLFIAIERYFSILDRALELGILRVLGAGRGYYFLILLVETFLICVPATLAGTCLTFVIRWGMQFAFPEFLKLDTEFTAWLIALVTVTIASLIGSGIGAVKAIENGVIQALSYEK